jgi:hypothetical protein
MACHTSLNLETKLSGLNYWSDEELVSSAEEETTDTTQGHGREKKHAFGPIPPFTRVFEVTVCVDSSIGSK